MRRFARTSGGTFGFGRQLLERVARRQREDREQHDADAEQARAARSAGAAGGSGPTAARLRRSDPAPSRRTASLRGTSSAAPRSRGPSRDSVGHAASALPPRTRGRLISGMTTMSLTTRSFILMNSAARLTGSISARPRGRACRTRRCASALMLRPCHLLALLRDLPRDELVHEALGVGLRSWSWCTSACRRRTCRRCRGWRRRRRRTPTPSPTSARARCRPSAHACLTIACVLLARRVDRGLVDELQLLAVLGADAVGALLPAGGVEDLRWPCRR